MLAVSSSTFANSISRTFGSAIGPPSGGQPRGS
jgi:hypothetical protein